MKSSWKLSAILVFAIALSPASVLANAGTSLVMSSQTSMLTQLDVVSAEQLQCLPYNLR